MSRLSFSITDTFRASSRSVRRPPDTPIREFNRDVCASISPRRSHFLDRSLLRLAIGIMILAFAAMIIIVRLPLHLH